MRILAETRLREAQLLLQAGEPSGAYYLAGYAIECALKAAITKGVRAYELPERHELKTLADSYVHDLNKLVALAGLDRALGAEVAANRAFGTYWLVTKDWRESSRYEIWSNRDAQSLVTAVQDPADGVLRWVRLHW